MRKAVLTALLLVLAGGTAFAQNHDARISLTSPDITDGGVIPDRHTQKAAPATPVSPALNWSGAPAATQSFVLVMHDLDVVIGTGTGDNLHWLAFNIPGTATGLAGGQPNTPTLADGTVQPGTRRNGYVPPGAPPPLYHHYIFELYALDAKLPLDAGASRDDVMKAMEGHVLDKGFLTARFHR